MTDSEMTDEQTLTGLKRRFVKLMDKLSTPLTEEESSNLLQEIHFCESGIQYFEEKLNEKDIQDPPDPARSL